MRTEKISPEQFDLLRRVISDMEARGHSPEVAIIKGCEAIHIDPPTATEGVNIVVEYALSHADGKPIENTEGGA